MSRDWTPEEIQAASDAMKAAGHMSYEEVCAELDATEKICESILSNMSLSTS